MFEAFSFLVNMLIQVFKDLGLFLAFFGIVIFTFSLMIVVLMHDADANYEGTGIFAYFFMAFRTSLGDFSIEDFKKTPP